MLPCRDGKHLCTSNRGSDSVSVFDASTARKLRDIPAGPGPVPNLSHQRYAVVSNLESSDVSVYDVRARKLFETVALPLARGPFEPEDPLGSYPNRVGAVFKSPTPAPAKCRSSVSVLSSASEF